MIEKISSLLLDELNKGSVTEIELASRIGISQGTINKLIKHRVMMPDITTLQRLSKYFGTPINYFLNDLPYDNETTAHPICREIADICATLDDEDKARVLQFAKDRADLAQIRKVSSTRRVSNDRGGGKR